MATGFGFKDTSTLKDFINSNDSTKYSYYKTSILEKIGDIEYPVSNVVYDYITELKAASVRVRLDESEKMKYTYRPDLLAYDFYGNMELDFIILAINDLPSAKDFVYDTIYIIAPDVLIELINTIFNSESVAINYNRANLG